MVDVSWDRKMKELSKVVAAEDLCDVYGSFISAGNFNATLVQGHVNRA